MGYRRCYLPIISVPFSNFWIHEQVIPKTDEQQARIREMLHKNYLFKSLDEEQTRVVNLILVWHDVTRYFK